MNGDAFDIGNGLINKVDDAALKTLITPTIGCGLGIEGAYLGKHLTIADIGDVGGLESACGCLEVEIVVGIELG